MPAYYHGLLLQFTLTHCEDYHWVNDLRSDLFPGRAPAHVTIFPAFSLRASRLNALKQRLDYVARSPWVKPFILDSCGVQYSDDWVGICLRVPKYRRRDRFKEIVEDIGRMIPGYATDEPHITVYQGPPWPTYIPCFDRVMSTARLCRNVDRLVDKYEDKIGVPLSIEVTGYELVQRGKVIASFSFDSQFEPESEAEEPAESESEEDEDDGTESE
ncbi:hypothetical protein FB45DRAFT_872902 [Roridomyces roridus]|uniref:Uncharacterized protein n=1 Tax=Roridomyces roridus TaxID=1738132 RepID=A0AAD7BBZ1_9AGAR|nr:hypothetical protein FB45DRAFT_872902 [Roridomyces roridus]